MILFHAENLFDNHVSHNGLTTAIRQPGVLVWHATGRSMHRLATNPTVRCVKGGRDRRGTDKIPTLYRRDTDVAFTIKT